MATLAPTRSPLAAIRDEERTLNKRIQTAEEQASAALADARAQAESIKQQAEREGLAEADRLYQEGIACAHEEADVMAQEGQAQAAQLEQEGTRRIIRAVDHIVAFVLPRIRSRAND